jgi:long-chain acyl-CoA synthetase
LRLLTVKIPNVLKAANKCPVLKVIISMDPLDPNATATKILQEWAAEKKIKLLTFNDVEKLGRERPLPHRPPTPEDVATIWYA